ncbi:GNAT family N-acetyltransferase [Nocardia sp. CA-128927]|uniref:GNAT family N-acetyltransferase n=1 Tax=Nocardia sp. CA-128927 TaxID=3239975 RepID=UPI003D95F261
MTKTRQLVVRPLQSGDERSFLDLRSALLNEGTAFAKDYEPNTSWSEYLTIQENVRNGRGLPPGVVSYTFLVADLGGVLVGSSDIRHRLTQELMHWGGHIGYVVAPQFRRRGYGSEILRQTLTYATPLGIDRARLTCRSDNLGSRAVIAACDGVLDETTPDGICQYWISVQAE